MTFLHHQGQLESPQMFNVGQPERVPLVTILGLEMRLKFFEVDQRLEMLRVPLGTILAREMRLKFCEVDQRLEMLRVALITILVREFRLKFFEVDQALEMLRVPLVTILAREMRSKVFSRRPSFRDVASAAGHDIGARNAIEIFRNQPTFGDVASAASHDIGARNAIESFFNCIWCQTANNVTGRARKISLKFVEKMSIFNRIYRANIVTSGPRSTSKACFVKNFQSHFSRQLRDLRHSHHTVSEDCMFQSHTPHQYRDKCVLARNLM